MAAWVIAFLFAIGGMAWVYSKLMRTTGGNTSSVIVATGILGLFIFFVAWSLISLFL